MEPNTTQRRFSPEVLVGLTFLVLLGPGALLHVAQSITLRTSVEQSAAAADTAWGGYIVALNITGQLQTNVYQSVANAAQTILEQPAPTNAPGYQSSSLPQPDFSNLINNGRALSQALAPPTLTPTVALAAVYVSAPAPSLPTR